MTNFFFAFKFNVLHETCKNGTKKKKKIKRKKSPKAAITAPPLNNAGIRAEAKVAPFRRNFFHILIHSNLFSAESVVTLDQELIYV